MGSHGRDVRALSPGVCQHLESRDGRRSQPESRRGVGHGRKEDQAGWSAGSREGVFEEMGVGRADLVDCGCQAREQEA